MRISNLYVPGRRVAGCLAAFVLWSAVFVPGVLSAMGVRPRVDLEMDNTSQGQLRFYAQMVSYRGAVGQPRLELSYTLGFSQLQFLGDSTGYRGGFTISAIAYDRKGNQIAGDTWERALAVRTYDATQHHDSIASGTVALALPPGEYRLVMAISDGNSQRSGVLESAVTVPRFNGPCDITEIAFSRIASGDTVPWPLRSYGDIAAPLLASCELYSQRPVLSDLAVTMWSLDDERTVWQHRQAQQLGERTALRISIPADSIVSGNYELRLVVEGDDGAVLARAQRTVIIDNAGLLTEKDYQYKIDQLRYLARPRELDTLKKAPAGLRDSLWSAFWRDRDPTPGTDRNELRDEYYSRVEYANQHFSFGIKKGWRTDMGQIYIRYGPPDDIERHPFDPEVPAFEVWYYYATNRKFVFSDLNGFGEFRLTYPINERMR